MVNPNQQVNEATKRKRRALSKFIQQEVIKEPSVQGVVAIGSVAMGTARAESDIDAIVFLEPFDLYAIPAEFKWQPDQGTFHGIFSHVENGIQLDFERLDLKKWSLPSYVWPEPICAGLSKGWLAFDRHGMIRRLIGERIYFSDEIRQVRLDEAFGQLSQLLDISKAERTWATLGPVIAHGRLHAAFDYLVQGLFAYNRCWRTYRSRELSSLVKLPWLPDGFEEKILPAMNALSVTQDGYQKRLAVLRDFLDELTCKCQQDGLYGANVFEEAFIRQHDEPGRDWNMEEWTQLHQQRSRKDTGVQ
jgi:predicted nucleotidyltransferase